MITAEMIVEAEANTEWHREKIQGFCYRAETSDRHQHVVRDLTRTGSDWLWSKDGSPADYDDTHAAMMTEIKRTRAAIIADELNALMGKI